MTPEQTQYDTLPSSLRAHNRWVLAAPESRNGSTTKVPYCAFDPQRGASSTDPDTWTDFDSARDAVSEKRPWLGFMLGDGFVGIDLDHCRDPDSGLIETWAQEIVDEIGAYTEISISGTGVHVICRGALPAGRRRQGQIEMYDSARYFVVSGRRLCGEVVERTTALEAVHKRVFKQPRETAQGVVEVSTLDDVELLNAVRRSRHASVFEPLWTGDHSRFTSPSEADAALCSILAQWTQDPQQIDRIFRQGGLYRAKWDRPDYRDKTVAHALERAKESGGKESGQGRSQASQLVQLVTARANTELFHSADHEAYCTIDGRTTSLNDPHFKRWLAREFWRTSGAVTSASSIGDAVSALAGLALHDGPTRETFTRIAALPDRVYVDLCDGHVVEITADGWTVIDQSPVCFLQHAGMLPLPRPIKSNEDLSGLFRSFLNVSDKRDLHLVIAWTVAALRGRKPFPVLSVSGEQGSAKSCACRYIRRLIDPNKADSRLSCRNTQDLMIAAHNGYVISLENLTRLDESLTNGLCCLATGAGAATRTLFTDKSETIINVARPIVLNGINDVATRPDLLDRTIAITLDPIPRHSRRTEAEVDAAFEKVQPLILGRLLDAVVCALKNEPTTFPKNLPRLADFCRTITAAEPALGWKAGSFIALFNDRRRADIERLLEGDPLVMALERLKLPWCGTAEALRRALVASNPTQVDQLPKTPKALGMKLRTLQSSLREIGISITFHKGHNRQIEIVKTDLLIEDDDDGVEVAA